MRALKLRLPAPRPGSCRVLIGTGALSVLPRDLVALRPARVVVVSDANVARLHARRIASDIARAGLPVDVLTFPAGERHKSRATKARLEDRLAQRGTGRDTILAAIGGGVTCDLAGFVAATWHRGIPVVQVPTTLLAMVDAAIGGKTGVNLKAAKNQIGAFHQPIGVYADPSVLATLDRRRYREGLAEIVKIALVQDREFFTWIERNAAALRDAEERVLERAIVRAVAGKLKVVRADEREEGGREILNCGHTVGHAIESASSFSVPHGQAVAIGLVVEGHIATHKVGFPRTHVELLERVLETLGLPRRIPPRISIDDVLVHLRADKKTRRGRTRYALPRAIGRMGRGASRTLAVETSEARAALRARYAR